MADKPLPMEEKSAEAAKKKKKKKAKKQAEPADGQHAACPPQPPPLHDAHERYLGALSALRNPQGEEEAFWISLSNCGIGDKKARKLAEALKQSGGCSLTSIDLSDNLISDSGAAALTAALQTKAVAPRLLNFSLVGNPLSEDGRQGCETALAARSDLKFILPSPSASANASSASALADDSCSAFLAYVEGADEEELTFERSTELLIAVAACDRCRSQHVRALEFLVSAVHTEMQEAMPNAKVLPRGMRWCSRNMRVLEKLLDCPGCLRVGSRSRLGAHQLQVISLLHACVRAKRGPLTGAILESKPCILGRCIDLMFTQNSSGLLHTAVIALTQEVRSYVHQLISPITEGKPIISVD
ncbi:MAG: hypothetical protein SGPRY_002113 [Prymnesium sp.]